MRRHALSLASSSALLLAVACADPVRPPTVLAPGAPSLDVGSGVNRNVPGTTRHYIKVGGVTREFWVRVGQAAPRFRRVPVVFMLHGAGGEGGAMLNNSRWMEKADTMGFIAVFPTALTYCHRKSNDPGKVLVETVWNQGALGVVDTLCTASEVAALPPGKRQLVRHPVMDDVAFLDAVIASLKSQYLVDPKRFYASGFSNGGEMTSRLLVERSWTFAALASHAGNMRVAPMPVGARHMTFIRSVGNQDPNFFFRAPSGTMPIYEDAINLAGMQSNFVTSYLSQGFLDNTYAWQPAIWDGTQVGRWVYTTSLTAESNWFAFLLFGGNGHAYPDGVKHPVTMADRLWPFFASQVLP